MRTTKKEESTEACGDGGPGTLRWSHADQWMHNLQNRHSHSISQIFLRVACGVTIKPQVAAPADLSTCNSNQEFLHIRIQGLLSRGFESSVTAALPGMAGGVHLFRATNRAWRPGAGSEWLRLEVGAKQGSDGTECRCGYGVRFRVSWPGKQVAAAMAGSCTDAPSCIFVGPIETAEKARLEALYQQARDSYYSGQPLVVDDMFDKVEMQLRWHGSKLVLKYPRCSLRRFTAYADAEVDPSQMRALKTIWSLIFAAGLSLAVGLPTLVSAYTEFNPHEPGTFVMSDTNRMFLSVVSFLVGAPVAQAAVKQLLALGRGDLVALKGCCPNCGEEVYTFVKLDHSSLKVRHESECHICERQLMFQATLHPSKSGLGQPWAHGRVYLQTRAHQLAPARRAS